MRTLVVSGHGEIPSEILCALKRIGKKVREMEEQPCANKAVTPPASELLHLPFTGLYASMTTGTLTGS